MNTIEAKKCILDAYGMEQDVKVEWCADFTTSFGVLDKEDIMSWRVKAILDKNRVTFFTIEKDETGNYAIVDTWGDSL